MALILLRLYVFVRPPLCYDCNKSGHSIDGIQTTCFNQGTGVAFQVWLRDFYLLQSVQAFCGLYLASYPLDAGSCLPGLKWSKREDVEVKNIGRIPSWREYGPVTVICYSVNVSSDAVVPKVCLAYPTESVDMFL